VETPRHHLTLTAPDVLVVTLHGWHRRRCMNGWKWGNAVKRYIDAAHFHVDGDPLTFVPPVLFLYRGTGGTRYIPKHWPLRRLSRPPAWQGAQGFPRAACPTRAAATPAPAAIVVSSMPSAYAARQTPRPRPSAEKWLRTGHEQRHTLAPIAAGAPEHTHTQTHSTHTLTHTHGHIRYTCMDMSKTT